MATSIARAWNARVRRDDVLAVASVGTLLLATLAMRAWIGGASAWTSLLTFGWTIAWVLAPGLACRRALRTRCASVPGELGLALIHGIALLIVAFVATRALEISAWMAAWPAVVLPLWLASRKRIDSRSTNVEGAAADRVEASSLAHVTLALLVLATIATVSCRGADAWWFRVDVDAFFHAGNVAELTRDGPASDPRVAGLPLNYHLYSYVLPAVLASLGVASAHEAFFTLLPAFVPCVLVLLVHGAAAELGRRAWAGVVAVALFLAHADPSRALLQLEFVGEHAFRFSSWTAANLTASPTASLSVACSLALMYLIAEWWRAPGATRVLGAVALLSFACAGARGPAMPVLCGALLAVECIGRRRGGASFGVTRVLLVMACASLPVTLNLSLGAHSYAGAMLRVDPMRSVAESGFAYACFGRELDLGQRALLLLPWIVGYVGVGAWIGLAWGFTRRRDLIVWTMALSIVAFVPVLFSWAPGRSQLFFGHPAEIAWVVLGGAALAGVDRWRSVPAVVAWSLGGVGLLFGGVVVVARAWECLSPPPAESVLRARWREGVTWLREHTPAEAVLVTTNHRILISALAERRVLFESGRFTPEVHADDRGPDPWRERRELSERLRDDPRPDLLADVRDLLPGTDEVYVVLDALVDEGPSGKPPSIRCGTRPDLPETHGDPRVDCVFDNEAIGIVRLRLR